MCRDCMETTGIRNTLHWENSAPLSPLGLKGQGRLDSHQNPFWLLSVHFPHCSQNDTLSNTHTHTHIQSFKPLNSIPQSLKRIKMNILTQPIKPFVICPLCHITSFFWDHSPPRCQTFGHSGLLLYPWIHHACVLPPKNLCIMLFSA